MKIALFADIHGKMLLPFALVDIYQQETGEKINLILQCGDMGAYPNMDNLDKATLKHAQYDRDELGFYDDCIEINPKIQAFLQTLNLDMICVRGNHEDHDFLDNLEQNAPKNTGLFAIDVYKKIWVCKTGFLQKITCPNTTQSLHLLGIGRIGDRKNRTEKRFLQEYERQNINYFLKKNNEIIDILLTHDKNESNQRGYGMAEIDEILDHQIVHFHIHGHTGEPFNLQKMENNITTQIKIKELEFTTEGILPDGCMVILEKKQNHDFGVKVVPKKITNLLSKHSWKFFLA